MLKNSFKRKRPKVLPKLDKGSKICTSETYFLTEKEIVYILLNTLHDQSFGEGIP